MSVPRHQKSLNVESEPAPEPRMRSSFSRLVVWFHNLLGTAILGGFAYYVWTHRTETTELLEASATDLALLIALILLTLGLNATQNWLLLRGVGVLLSFREGLVLTFAANFGNYLPMRAGTLIRAHYLKSVHGLRYARFGSVFGIRSLITLFGGAILGLAGTLWVAISGGRLSAELLLGFSVILLVPLVAWMVPVPERRTGVGRIRRIIQDFLQGAAELRRQPKTGGLVLTLILLQELALMARFYVANRAGDGEASLSLLLLLSPVATLASYAALTPGALGLREAAMGAATYAVGTTFSSGVLLGTLDRTVLLGVVALAGGLSFLWVWLRIRVAERVEPQPAEHGVPAGLCSRATPPE